MRAGWARVLCKSLLALLLASSIWHPRAADLKYGPKKEASAQQLRDCSFKTPTAFDSPEILRQLYGGPFVPERKGQGSIVVLGNHNSGTSMLTRLIMLMGAFHGNLNGLSTSPTNRLKYWEKIDVSHFHDMLLRAVADNSFKPYHAQDVDMSRASAAINQTLTCFVGKIVKDLDRHRPWVIKDPRMLLFSEQWIAQMKHPVCVIVFRDPVANAVSLTDNSKKSGESNGKQPMTVQRWLSAWEEGMLTSLLACQKHPALILQLDDMQEDLERFTYKLVAMLGQAGVIGLQMPSRAAMRKQFGSYLKEARQPKARGPDDASATLSRSQTALLSALQLVANSPDYGLSMEVHRADAVVRVYWDIVRNWGVQSQDASTSGTVT